MLAENQNSHDRSSTGPSRNLKGNSTYRDYAAMPEGAPYELIEGELVMNPGPTPGHQRAKKKIVHKFINFIEGKRLGEVLDAPIDVYLDDYNTLQPDILVIQKGNEAHVEAEFIRGAPDLVVEILSPSNPGNDLHRKKRLYAEFGVQEYWVADPEARTILQFWNTGAAFELRGTLAEEDRIESLLFPGLRMDLAAVFSQGYISSS